ncbi:MAG: alpha/beta hydrolase-fold protein [Betaproteobacteria bacterium]
MSPSRIRDALRQVLFAAVVAAASGGAAAQPLPQVATGRIERLADFPSRHVDTRHVDVWLPADYSPARRYQVLYMHDGQMLFDAATTWNKQAWDVHLTVDRLVRAGRLAPTLIVGVWNSGRSRHSEYYPEKFLPYVEAGTREPFVTKALQGAPRADAYLRFLVEELKPAIDARFATLPGRESTFLMGSSMGALISIYALSEYPQVFGGAAGLSVHWVGTGEPNAALPLAAFNYLRDRLGAPQGRRLYMDRGTTELDAIYGPYQTFVDEIVRDRGWGAGQVMSRVFEGTGHNERAWAARLEVPLSFMMGR